MHIILFLNIIIISIKKKRTTTHPPDAVLAGVFVLGHVPAGGSGVDGEVHTLFLQEREASFMC